MTAYGTMKALKCLLHIAIVWIVQCRSVGGLTVIHEGGNVSLSWKQPDPPVREFSILKSGICVFNVTDFDNVTACNPRVEFTGNVTSDGAGVFSFVLLNVTQDDDGLYICYGGSPYHRGSRIAHCGEGLHVLDVNATYGLHGEPLSISWNLPNPGVKEFTVMKLGECFFHVVNYNQVSKCGVFNGIFTGNITQSGSGVFSFDLSTLSKSDDGYFRCFAGSPSSKGPRIPACGQEVSVISDLEHPYIVGPDVPHPGEGLQLACHINIVVNSNRYHHIIASFTWWRNGVILETGDRYSLSSTHAQWEPRVRYHISHLAINNVSMVDDTDNYTCQAQLDHRLRTEKSDAFTIGKKLPTELYMNYTLAREGGNATMVWKMPQADDQAVWFRILNPRGGIMMSMLHDTVHVFRIFWTRIKITRIIVFPDSRALLLTMFNVMLTDAGHYRCDRSLCDNILVVQKPPAKPSIHGSDVAVVKGNLRLTCNSEAQSLPREYRQPLSYIWRGNSKLLERGGEYAMEGPHLIITDVNVCHRGRYSCQTKERSLASVWSDDVSVDIIGPAPHVSPPVQATPGQSVTLTCSSSAWGRSRATHVAYTWRRNNVTVESGGRYQLEEGTLTITDARKEDEGTYSCRTEQDTMASDWSETTEVLIWDPAPHVSAPVQATPGQTVTLTCSSSAWSRSRATHVAYTWRSNNVTVESGGRYQLEEGTLTITDARKEDEGTYSCRTEQETMASDWSETTEVLIWDPAPHVSAPVQATPGQTVTLTCSSSAWSRSRATHVAYTWRRNNVTVESGGRYQLEEGTLTITDARKEDEGTYSCRTEQDTMASDWSETTEVLIWDPTPHVSAPVQATPGQTVTLTCSSSAWSRSRATHVAYTWRRNNVTVESGGRYQLEEGTLTITDARKEDEGTYSCRTEQETMASDWSETTEVLIWDPAPHVSAPVQATPGQTVTLTCSSSAWSRSRATHVAYTWRSNNVTVESGGRYQLEEGTLTITDARKEDEGTYSCRTEQDTMASDWSETTEVLIWDPAPHVSAPVQATPGQTLTLTCSSSAWSRSRATHVAYTWRRNNVPVKSGGRYQLEEGTLTITDSRKEDEGTYSCRTEQDTLASDWSETTKVLIWAEQSHTTTVVAVVCAADLASAAVISILLYKKMKRSVEIRYIPADNVRMSDIDQPDIYVSDQDMLIQG